MSNTPAGSLEEASVEEPWYPLDVGLSRKVGVARSEESFGESRFDPKVTFALSRLPSRCIGCDDSALAGPAVCADAVGPDLPIFFICSRTSAKFRS